MTEWEIMNARNACIAPAPRIPATRPLVLEPGELLTLDRVRGSRVVAHSGRLLVTEAGFAGDFVLAPGDAYRVRGAGRVVLEALECAALVVCPAPGPIGALAARLALWHSLWRV